MNEISVPFRFECTKTNIQKTFSQKSIEMKNVKIINGESNAMKISLK
jgi:hypothetical protein